MIQALRWDMRLTDREVLLIVHDQPTITWQQMSEHLGVDVRSIARCIRRLAQHGYISRERLPRNRVRYHIAYDSLPESLRVVLRPGSE